MEKKDFLWREDMCLSKFMEAGDCFHVCSQENHPVLFHNEKEFKAAMNIIAYAAASFKDLKIFTFEIMDNHVHFAISGQKSRIESMLKMLISKLAANPVLIDSSSDIRGLSFNIFPIDSLDNLRNVIAYINRNGAVVNPDENAFTYEWGANRFFFNREATLRFNNCGKKTTFRERRKLFHSDSLSDDDKIIILDEYISPLCYCHIANAQLFFRNSRQYFYCISRNVESYVDIAKMIGEQIFYSDTDLFTHIMSKCAKDYGCRTIAALPKDSKIELAKDLHFNFNAGNKQISRLLKLDLPIVNTLFPGNA